MPDTLDINGLQLKTNEELVTELEDALKEIYGADINLSQNSPDKQWLENIAQQGTDIRELVQQVYSSFDPDQAIGTTLDGRVSINNIERQGGTYTSQPVELTFDRVVSLQGLDANFNNPTGDEYTVQDDAGTQFILIDSYTSSGAETIELSFRASDLGQVEVQTNTITTQTTVVLGVTNVNNPSAPTEVGADQESDANLKIRRSASLAINSLGWVDAMRTNLLATEGVTDASVFENVTSSVDADGIPAHGMWAIVEGGANTDIANTIYAKKNPGCNMKGTVMVAITTASGGTFTAKFDRPTAKRLYIRFNIFKTDPSAIFDTQQIANDLASALTYEIGETAETSKVTNAASLLIVGGTPVDVQISDDDIIYTYSTLPVDTRDEQWTVSADDITILGV